MTKENFVSSLESDSEIENIEGCRQTNYQGMKTPSQPYNEEGLNLDNLKKRIDRNKNGHFRGEMDGPN